MQTFTPDRYHEGRSIYEPAQTVGEGVIEEKTVCSASIGFAGGRVVDAQKLPMIADDGYGRIEAEITINSCIHVGSKNVRGTFDPAHPGVEKVFDVCLAGQIMFNIEGGLGIEFRQAFLIFMPVAGNIILNPVMASGVDISPAGETVDKICWSTFGGEDSHRPAVRPI